MSVALPLQVTVAPAAGLAGEQVAKAVELNPVLSSKAAKTNLPGRREPLRQRLLYS
ncbi:hypothetical protein [Pseudomonas rubra]|uniref:Uncharacterized protein n=1 Tax=Pseudomonas rubra TaxID=2942627 RepID=A0ABT5PG10_9PSED|nr:hypothetical protein [Pseudomonas rubra]MDD1017137.1 hypothetical protein [Pseudomonas rubra]MDD1040744.1 hypothetical protein [Pseudomonas rubra]MDD1154832.1 hypothetical protein [Pseudomonas rubra]